MISKLIHCIVKLISNLGRYYPYLGQTLQEFIANETTCCIPMVNSTWNSWNGFSTETGSFLLVCIVFIAMIICNIPITHCFKLLFIISIGLHFLCAKYHYMGI